MIDPRLVPHLAASYGIEVSGASELDEGVYRIDRSDGPSWVARLFPSSRPLERVRGDAEILTALEELAFPAERCAVANPVTDVEGQGLVVTAYVPSVPRSERRAAFRDAGGLPAVGALLGRLSSRTPSLAPFSRTGGAWHHLADGGPAAEIAAARTLLAGADQLVPAGQRALYDSLVEQLASLDDGAGLPEAFVHPDLVLANIVASQTGELVVVDWAGAGHAPRIWALAFMLWGAGYGGDLRRIDRVVAGYRRQIRPEPEELTRLAELIGVRPLILDSWAFCMGRRPLEQVAQNSGERRALAGEIAARARAALAR